MEFNPYDINYDIALKLSLPDIISLCNTNKIFNMICNNDHFWLNKFERDFPLNIKSNTYITNKQAYLSIYNENFDLFKYKMKMYKLDNFDLASSLKCKIKLYAFLIYFKQPSAISFKIISIANNVVKTKLLYSNAFVKD